MEYPTRRGISIPSSELDLPETRLDLRRQHTTNNHHMEWSRRSMGRFLITQTLRDLEGLQEVLPLDVHTLLHKRYEPPRFPTVDEAMDRVIEAYDNAEQMKVKAGNKYVLQPITDIHYKQIIMEYNRLK